MRRLGLFCLAGLLVVVFGISLSPAKSWAAYGDFITTFPNQTSIAGALLQPTKIAVDPANGNVYVTDDEGNVNVVKEYDKSGNFLSSFTVSGTPVGIAVDANNIFVGDSTNKCVWIYNKSGVYADLTCTGTSHKLGGPDASPLVMPNTITISPSGHIFVVDGDSDQVSVFRTDGSLNLTFGTSGSAVSSGTTIYCYYPSGLTMAESSTSGTSVTQYFYLGDQGNYRVQKLSYVYDSTTDAITTPPTFVATIGGEGDAWGNFLRVSDLAFDNTNRLSVLDSLQMVGQQYDTVGVGGTPVAKDSAFNYSNGVLGLLSTPTGLAVDDVNQRLYVANNQGKDISVFTTADGTLPTISIANPTGNPETPCTATYTVNFSGTAATSSATVDLYYYNTASPSTKTLFSSQLITPTSGAFSGSAILDLVGTYPNYIWAGTYGIYAEVHDSSYNLASATAPGTIGITLVGTYKKYTCAMQAKFGTASNPAQDTDGDGISDIDEIEGTYNNGVSTNPLVADTDNDGIDDGCEEGVKTLGASLVIGADGKIYTCIQNHTSDSTNEPGLAGSNWQNYWGLYGPASTATNPVVTAVAWQTGTSYTRGNNLPIPLAGGYIKTDPNNVDTDGGGVSDAVEVVKGTNPAAGNGSDDLVVASSPQDLVCDYFEDQTADLQNSTMTFKNIGATTAVLDFAFYNPDGTLLKTVPAAYTLAPNQCVRFNPYAAYGVSQGSLEVRSTSSRVTGDLYRYGNNYIHTAYLKPGGGANMWWPARKGTHLYSVVFADTDATGYRFRGYINLKNWSDSTANATINFYRNTDGTLVSVPITLAGHEATNLRPRDYVPYNTSNPNDSTSWTGGCVEVTSDIPITASQYITRYNATDSNSYDASFIYPFDNSGSSTSYGPAWSNTYSPTVQNPSDSSYRFIMYLYMYNPNSSAINAHLKMYDSNGVLCLDNTWAVQPHMKVGIQPINNFNQGSPPYMPTGGTFTVTSTYVSDGTPASHVSSVYIQRYDPVVGPNLIDWAYYVPSLQDTGVNTQYAGEYRDYPTTEPNQRFNCYYYMWNTDPVNTVNATVTYFNMDGSVAKTATHTLNPLQRIGVRPYNGVDKAPNEGSFTITTDNPFVGYIMGQEWNIDDPTGNTIDNAFIKMFWR